MELLVTLIIPWLVMGAIVPPGAGLEFPADGGFLMAIRVLVIGVAATTVFTGFLCHIRIPVSVGVFAITSFALALLLPILADNGAL